MKETLVLLGNTVHQLQKERGASTLFLGSDGQQFSLELAEQFVSTDQAVAALASAVESWTQQQPNSIAKLSYLLGQIEQLNKRREIVLANDCTPAQALYQYTFKTIAPLLEVMVELALYDARNDSRMVSAYNNFIQWKERIGRERSIGTLGLLNQSFDDQKFVERLRRLLTEQATYEQTFASLANQQQRQCVQQVFGGLKISDEGSAIAAVHQALDDTEHRQLDGMTAESWFHTMTEKIDKMYQVETLLLETLQNNSSQLVQVEDEAAMNQQINVIDSDLNSEQVNNYQRKFVRTLPFFSGFSYEQFEKLLQSAHTREYKKGKTLFIEGEQSTRFYIILQGWVKLYKGTIGGDETTLQMLSSGESIIESAVFLNVAYPLSAQIAENAVLMSFPGAVIRNLIRDENILAVNMVNCLSQRSQLLLQQIETTRLKTATERVGWFLLKTLITQPRPHENVVKLPYDKATIASFLDMKPETFSRTLKQFKGQGFEIVNDMIVLPKTGALCEFCDMDIAESCSRHKTDDCSHPS